MKIKIILLWGKLCHIFCGINCSILKTCFVRNAFESGPMMGRFGNVHKPETFQPSVAPKLGQSTSFFQAEIKTS